MNNFFQSDLPIVASNWYETFFTPEINTFWETLIPHNMTYDEVAFIERHLKLGHGTHVLDIPCGLGRHSLELARRGYRITGVDISADAIMRAKRIATDESLDVQFLQQDMNQLKLAGPFDAAICFGNSFGYLTHNGNVAFLNALSDQLKPNGRLIIDTAMIAESVLPLLEKEARYKGGDYMFDIKNYYDVGNSRLVTECCLQRGQQKWQRGFSHAVYTCGELIRMLATNGFEVEHLFANTQSQSFSPGQPRLLIIANRNAE